MPMSFAFASYGIAIGLGSGDGGVVRFPRGNGFTFVADAPGDGSAISEIVAVGPSTMTNFAAAVGTPELFGTG